MTDPRGRRSLTHVGGKVERTGNPEVSELLAHALDVTGSIEDEDSARAHVHGFHSYPARMHPVTASRLVNAFSPERGAVLDPFCGSGTVLVEALLANRDAFGSDINPLAVELAITKTSPLSKEDAELLEKTAWEAAAHADERRKRRAGATRKLPPEDVALFEPHVLLELDSVRSFLEKIKSSRVRMPLFLALSAIIVKVSRKESDTSEKQGARRIAAGYTAKLFAKKVEELCLRRVEFTQMLGAARPKSIVQIDDATKLTKIKPASIDAVISSPPYAGTYDYIAHHATRLRWLNLAAKKFEALELGSRRAYTALLGPAAHAQAVAETGEFLVAVARALKPGGHAIFVVGDSAVRRFALRADVIVAEAVAKTPFELLARATQTRKHFHAQTASAFSEAPRAEHAIALKLGT